MLQFWEDRVRDVAGQEIVYTLGMRGVHDSAMLGAKTVEDQKKALEKVLADQRELIAKYVNEDVRSVPQVFIPYKEVLDVYHAGLEVPDDVTLMWCDDNYGYIRHFPTAEEQARRGGNGIYYHVSYWVAPRLPLAWHIQPLPALPADERGLPPRHQEDVDTQCGRYQARRVPDRAFHGYGMGFRRCSKRGRTEAYAVVPRPRIRTGNSGGDTADNGRSLPPCLYPPP